MREYINCAQPLTCRLAVEFELLLDGGQRGDGVAEEHGLEQAEEAVEEDVHLFRSESLQQRALTRPQSAAGVIVFGVWLDSAHRAVQCRFATVHCSDALVSLCWWAAGFRRWCAEWRRRRMNNWQSQQWAP